MQLRINAIVLGNCVVALAAQRQAHYEVRMNTPAHLILSAGLFARPDARRVTAAALAGGLAPDLSLYLIAGWMMLGGQTPQIFFSITYYSDWMQGVMAVDNSIPLWSVGLIAAVALRHSASTAFAACGLIHVCTDFLLHNHDARRQFWPISDWVFQSPISYWDRDHYGDIAGWIEIAGAAIILVILWRRFSGWPARALIILAAMVQIAPGILFRLLL